MPAATEVLWPGVAERGPVDGLTAIQQIRAIDHLRNLRRTRRGLLIFAVVGLRPSTESRLSRFGWSLLTALGVNTFPCSSVDHPANVRRVVNLIRRVAGDCAASAEG
jgi:hypothetical protein